MYVPIINVLKINLIVSMWVTKNEVLVIHVHNLIFETIWNCKENVENRDAKWCILTAFETILNYREKNMKTRTLNGAFWRYLKQFGIADTFLKTRTLNSAFWRHSKLFGTGEKKMKTRTINGAFWLYLKWFRTAEIILTQERVIYILNCHEKKQQMLQMTLFCDLCSTTLGGGAPGATPPTPWSR